MQKAIRYLTQYPIDQDLLKYGVSQSDQKQVDYLRYLEIENLKTRWELLAAKEESIYLINPELIQCLKNKYIGLAMEASLQCVAAYSSDLNNLTSHGHRFWKVFTWRKVAPIASEIASNAPCAGLIGSLASYTYCTPKESWPKENIPIIRSLLDAFWQDLNISQELTPNQKITSLLNILNFDFDYIDKSRDALEIMLTEDPELKLSLIDTAILKALPLRILFGDIPDKFISHWSRIQSICNNDTEKRAHYKLGIYSYQKPFTLLQAGLVIARGGGWALVLQALYVEALLNIATLLPTDTNLTVNEFIVDGFYQRVRFKLAENFALCADIQNLFSLFDTIKDSHTKAQEYLELSKQWLDTTEETEIKLGSRNRLPLMLRAASYT